MFLSSQADELDLEFTDPLFQPYGHGTTGSQSPEEMKTRTGRRQPRAPRTNVIDTRK